MFNGIVRDIRHSLVLGEGLRFTSAGLVIGLAISVLSAQMLRGLLFEIDTLDPMSMLVAALVLVGVSTLASYVPARRATRVDPMLALRAE